MIFPFSYFVTFSRHIYSLLFYVYVHLLTVHKYESVSGWAPTSFKLEQVHCWREPLYLQLVLQAQPSMPQSNTLAACIFITSLLPTHSFKNISLISDLFKNLLVFHFLTPSAWAIFHLHCFFLQWADFTMKHLITVLCNNFQMPSKRFYHCQLCCHPPQYRLMGYSITRYATVIAHPM